MLIGAAFLNRAARVTLVQTRHKAAGRLPLCSPTLNHVGFWHPNDADEILVCSDHGISAPRGVVSAEVGDHFKMRRGPCLESAEGRECYLLR
jgi:hypothetical protein